MAIHINKLDGGNITITTGPATRSETRIWWSSDESNYNDYLIEGALDCPVLIEKGLMPEGSGTEAPPYWNNQPVKIEIGSAVTSIGDYVFNVCSNLTSITIPNSVTSIRQGAFSFCRGLTSVTIPANVTNIEKYAFQGCSGLTSVTIGDNVTSIGEEAFYDCSGLTSVTIVATGKPGASATSVKQAMITAGCPSNITWNMPS